MALTPNQQDKAAEIGRLLTELLGEVRLSAAERRQLQALRVAAAVPDGEFIPIRERLNVREKVAAEVLGISLKTLRRKEQNGELELVRIGKIRTVTVRSLLRVAEGKPAENGTERQPSAA